MDGLENLFAKRMQGPQSSIVANLLRYAQMEGMISLAGGVPAADTFDIRGINEAAADALKAGVLAFQYSVTEGERGLREEIVNLVAERGIKASVDEIVVTSGSQQGIDLIAQSFLDRGDKIAVERPTYLAALEVFEMCEADIIEIEGSDEGIDLDALEATLKSERIKALYIVPTFANPTGSTLSREDRQRLVELAAKYHFIIFEDDPYGEIRFTDRKEPTLYELSLSTPGAKGYVLYLSSFSKILVPGLRLGFIIGAPSVADRLVTAKQSLDLHSPVLGQLIVESYLKGGRLAGRLPLICQTYEERCRLLMEALRTHIGEYIEFNEPEGGMFLWARFNSDIDSEALLSYAVKEGVAFVPGIAFYANNPDRSTVRLSFATITAEEADEAGHRLARALKAYLAK